MKRPVANAGCATRRRAPRAVARAGLPDAHVMSGAAGCLIFLLRLHQARPDDSLLNAAVRSGDHIVRTVHSRHPGRTLGPGGGPKDEVFASALGSFTAPAALPTRWRSFGA